MNFEWLYIKHFDDMERLVTVLTNNGYKVSVEPVYETEDDLRNQNRYINMNLEPRIKHYAVEIVGTIVKPVYGGISNDV